MGSASHAVGGAGVGHGQGAEEEVISNSVVLG